MPMDSPVDAKTSYTFNMEQHHIDDGVPGSPYECAGALATKDNPEVLDAEVWKSRAFIQFGPGAAHLGFRDGQWYRFRVPNDLRFEALTGDRGGRIEPGEYTFLPLPKSKHATGKQQGSKTSQNGKIVTVVNPLVPKKIRKYKITPGVRPSKTY
jgi:hypothetical protein